jgi:hypothetical protein
MDSIKNAADYFAQHGTDNSICSILCGAWYYIIRCVRFNQFSMQKNIQGGENYMILLMYVAKEVLKLCSYNTEQQSRIMKD